MQKKVWVGFIALCALISPLYGQSKKSQWVDSVFNTLDLEGKIGQAIIIPAVSHSDPQLLERQVSRIKKFKIGGIIFTKGGPVSQVNITNYFQQQATVPLLIGMNAGEGLGTELDSTTHFPSPIMLGSLRDDSLLFYFGAEIGRQLTTLGVTMNLAPNADVNASVNSYGQHQEKTAAKALAYQNGLRTTNMLCIPTFTQTESANVLPLQQLLKNGATGMSIDYRTVFALPEHKKLLTSKLTSASNALVAQFSPSSITTNLTFNGLTISSIPDIRELNKNFKAGDSEVLVLRAGNDMLLFPDNLNATVRRLRRAIRTDKVLQKQLDESVKKILAVKFDAGLSEKKIVRTENLLTRLNTPASSILQAALFERSVTVVKDEQQFLPIQQLDEVSFASLSIGIGTENPLTSYLSKYAAFTHYKLQAGDDSAVLVQNLSRYDWIIAGIYAHTTELENVYYQILQELSFRTKVIVVNMGSASNLARIDGMPAIVQAYTDHELIQKFIPQLIFGAKKADGTLPVSVSEKIKQGDGIQTSLLHRMAYSVAEEAGVDSKTMDKIALVAREAIEQKAAPGSQVLVARHGKIIYEESFGAQTYENGIPVNDHTIYDLASLTKVMATLQAVMFLYDKGMIDIYKKASVYLPELLNTNKKDIILKDVLTHQSGLVPFLLMWPQTVKGDTLLAHYYSPVKNESYPLQVAPGLFASPVIQDSVWQWVLKSEMLNKPPRTPYSPRYSDLGFMILHRLVERLLNQPIEDFLSQNLYEPIGSGTMGYLPLTKFPATQIAPTEMDTIFRKTTVLGTVHDERAAMLGGVAGHAGLFGSGIDLIKLGQMLLQKGSYGGQQFYFPETIELFAQKQFENSTRGLGWAKPGDPNSPSSRFGSTRAFGHTGFTGTCIWIDPEFDLVFVFLSNSRFPYRSGKLNTTNIRSRIQDLIYQSIFNYCQYGGNEPDRKLIEYLRNANN